MIMAERASERTRSSRARSRFLLEERRPLFRCSWDRVLMIHYEVEAEALQPLVPFELDLFDGKASVSAVAFTLGDMRFGLGGPPFATHGFLNVRTYVRHRGEVGIFFLAEWLPNPLCVFLGPRLYGLPYRRGRLDYDHRHETGAVSGRVNAGDGALAYRARIEPGTRFEPCEPGSLDEFVLERYAAFTHRSGRVRRFRVWHPPWPQVRIPVTVDVDNLLDSTGAWFGRARRIGAHYSPGFSDVWMGFPREVTE